MIFYCVVTCLFFKPVICQSHSVNLRTKPRVLFFEENLMIEIIDCTYLFSIYLTAAELFLWLGLSVSQSVIYEYALSHFYVQPPNLSPHHPPLIPPLSPQPPPLTPLLPLTLHPPWPHVHHMYTASTPHIHRMYTTCTPHEHRYM